MRTLGFVIFDGVFDSGISVLLDLFHSGLPSSDFKVLMASPKGEVITTARGLQITPSLSCSDLALETDLEMMIVPGLPFDTSQSLEAWLQSPEVAEVTLLLRESYHRGRRIAAGCTGTYLLAKTGLLNGLRATTTKNFAPVFCRLFPEVRVCFDSMITHDKGVICAGSAMAHIELGLFLLSLLVGPAKAESVAKDLLLDQRESAGHLRLEWLKSGAEPWLQNAFKEVQMRLEEPISVEELAKTLGWSRRTLVRRFQKSAGCSPKEFIQQIRLGEAKRFLRSGEMSVEETAYAVGYENPNGLRKAFQSRWGRSPLSFR